MKLHRGGDPLLSVILAAPATWLSKPLRYESAGTGVQGQSHSARATVVILSPLNVKEEREGWV